MNARLGVTIRGPHVVDVWFGQFFDYVDEAREFVRRGVQIARQDIQLEPYCRSGVLADAGWQVHADPADVRWEGR